jgi:hypothetical protein
MAFAHPGGGERHQRQPEQQVQVRHRMAPVTSRVT